MKTLFLTLGLLITFACSTYAQDSAVALSCRSPIMADRICRSFTVDGLPISYDSCKRLLVTFHSSATELVKALRLENRVRVAFPIAVVLVLPTFGFTTADEATNGNTPWVDATANILSVLMVGDAVYIWVNQKNKRKHLRRAIDLYNAEIKRTASR